MRLTKRDIALTRIDVPSSVAIDAWSVPLSSIHLVLNCLKLKCDEITDISKLKTINDLNFLTNVKRSTEKNTKYIQTFEEKNGFINDLSILDLLFNCGPNSLDYIK